MKKWKLYFDEYFDEPQYIIAGESIASEIFDALCDYYGIDDDVNDIVDGDGLYQRYIKDENGDYIALMEKQNNE